MCDSPPAPSSLPADQVSNRSLNLTIPYMAQATVKFITAALKLKGKPDILG